jgi:hypothetical protein
MAVSTQRIRSRLRWEFTAMGDALDGAKWATRLVAAAHQRFDGRAPRDGQRLSHRGRGTGRPTSVVVAPNFGHHSVVSVPAPSASSGRFFPMSNQGASGWYRPSAIPSSRQRPAEPQSRHHDPGLRLSPERERTRWTPNGAQAALNRHNRITVIGVSKCHEKIFP